MRQLSLLLTIRVRVHTLLVLFFLGTWTFGQAALPDETISRITANLMCTCGCPHIIGQCGDECGVAPQLVQEISQLLSTGKTEEEIYAVFEAKYGLSVLAVPKAEGFNLLVWVFPFLGLLVGGVIVFVVIRNLKPGQSDNMTQGVTGEIDDKYRELIDKEMRQ